MSELRERSHPDAKAFMRLLQSHTILRFSQITDLRHLADMLFKVSHSNRYQDARWPDQKAVDSTTNQLFLNGR
jgi:hypothetical protein